MAKKRMHKEDVFGNKISVGYLPRLGEERQDTSLGSISRPPLSCHSDSSSRESSPICNQLNELTRFNDSLAMPPPSNLPERYLTPTPPLSSHFLDRNQSSIWTPMPAINKAINSDGEASTNKMARAITSRSNLRTDSQFNLASSLPPNKSVGRVSPFMLVNDHQFGPRSNPRIDGSFSNFPINSNPRGIFDPMNLEGGLYSDRQISQRSIQSPVEFNRAQNLREQTLSALGGRNPSPVAVGLENLSCSSFVELLVTNLDQSLDINEMKNIIFAAFREHVMVLHISMLLQPDGTHKAMVKVPTAEDAQYAISQLHRRKIGHKRILISYTHSGKLAPLYIVKSEVAALLCDIPTKKMPLFKFRELFEFRYHRPIGISELYKLGDVVLVTEELGGRMIELSPNYRATPSPIDSLDGTHGLIVDKAFCEIHMRLPETQGWGESEITYHLPDVYMSLKSLSPCIHTLLDTHQGCLPLNSFCACYRAEFGSLPVSTGNDPSRPAVQLEHLIACIPGIQITKSNLGIKKVQWLENNGKDIQGGRCISPALVGQLALFSREVVDLLKNQFPRCCLPFNKFIPQYHHHFGRQCRVADYGYTKLIDLLEAIPHVVQILGQGQNRLMTLTHRAQVKRFASDLLRVLKSLPTKQVSLTQFHESYRLCFEKALDVGHYGVCDLKDLILEMSENIVVTDVDGELVIGIPKREQTQEEMERTKEFSSEVVELLRHTPSCQLTFNKFIPSYHHHFNRQCRVSDYGFSKLVELLEAIPDILEVTGSGEEKILSLTLKEKLKVLAERMVKLVKEYPAQSLPLKDCQIAYLRHNGYPLKVEDYGVANIHQLIELIKSSVQVQNTREGQVLTLIDKGQVQQVDVRVCCLLMEHPEGKIGLAELVTAYTRLYNSHLDIGKLMAQENQGFTFKEGSFQLSPLYLLVRDILSLICHRGGHLPLQNLDAAFYAKYGCPCQPAKFGFASLPALIKAFPQYFLLKGRRGKKLLVLADEFEALNILPSDFNRSKIKQEMSQVSLLGPSPVDIFNQPIPSNCPSPNLWPELDRPTNRDLMGFESPFNTITDDLNCMSEKEKQQFNQIRPINSRSMFYGGFYADPPCFPRLPEDSFRTNDSRPHSRGSLCFTPIPPASWLAELGNYNMTVSNGSSQEWKDVSALCGSGESSLCGPSPKPRPRSRIAALFSLEKQNLDLSLN